MGLIWHTCGISRRHAKKSRKEGVINKGWNRGGDGVIFPSQDMVNAMEVRLRSLEGVRHCEWHLLWYHNFPLIILLLWVFHSAFCIYCTLISQHVNWNSSPRSPLHRDRLFIRGGGGGPERRKRSDAHPALSSAVSLSLSQLGRAIAVREDR